MEILFTQNLLTLHQFQHRAIDSKSLYTWATLNDERYPLHIAYNINGTVQQILPQTNNFVRNDFWPHKKIHFMDVY